MTDPAPWWRRGVVYQVYPRSFQDSNADGVGDLPGILSRLDHLAWLGVDALWLSPIYLSPMADFGYDVADHTAIDPVFGTLGDFDRLLAAAHARGLRLVLDYVPNHTSDRHEWFRASRASRENPRRGWYLWRDPGPGGGPPNNWLSEFGGSAWEFDGASGQYYLHTYLREQPDLNWRNPAVERAMFDVLRFWLDRGVDGFRVDAVTHCLKDDRFRDNPPNPEFRPGANPYKRLLPLHTADLPEVHHLIARMRALLDGYGERAMIAEIYAPIEKLVAYYGAAEPEAHLPTNFALLKLPWDAAEVGATIARYEAALPPGTWPNWTLGNHDKPRVASRVGVAQARVAAMLLLTLRGTPTIYYGDEIGMRDVPVPPDKVRDPWGVNVPGLGLGRDPQRTPMQWDDGPAAGFTAGEPWLPTGESAINVRAQFADPRSMLWLHRRLLALRRAESALSTGGLALLHADGGVLAYLRTAGDRNLMVALNMASRPAAAPVPGEGRVLIDTALGREGERARGSVALAPDEGLVLELP
ncbi:MAG: DUF3459 domain-containing protein [Acidobacteria bacterium]|nr:DUF3459 domain-containing protein [Acidobacteriota bacterium]